MRNQIDARLGTQRAGARRASPGGRGRRQTRRPRLARLSAIGALEGRSRRCARPACGSGRRTLTLLRRLYPELSAARCRAAASRGRRRRGGSRAGPAAAAICCSPYAHSLALGQPRRGDQLHAGQPGAGAGAARRAATAAGCRGRRARSHAPEDMLFTCTPALDVRCHQQAFCTRGCFSHESGRGRSNH